MSNREKNRKAFSKVLSAVLKAKRISQRQAAIDLDTSPSNFNQRIISGSMRPDMIMKLNQMLEIDLLTMVQRHENGEPIEQIISSNNSSASTPTLQNLTTYDIDKALANQSNAIAGLQVEIKELVQQLNKWIENDIKKTGLNEEMINLIKENQDLYKQINRNQKHK